MRESDELSLMKTFRQRLFDNGLYREIMDSKYKTLVYRDSSIYIGSLCMAGRILVTVENKNYEDSDYCQITFYSQEENPEVLAVRSSEGSYKSILDMLVRASEKFGQGSNVMKHDSIVYAGVEIGGN